MVNLQADPPQGRSASKQLRTTGRFSIPFISPPQGLGLKDVVLPPNAWIDNFNNVIIDNFNNDVVFNP